MLRITGRPALIKNAISVGPSHYGLPWSPCRLLRSVTTRSHIRVSLSTSGNSVLPGKGPCSARSSRSTDTIPRWISTDSGTSNRWGRRSYAKAAFAVQEEEGSPASPSVQMYRPSDHYKPKVYAPRSRLSQTAQKPTQQAVSANAASRQARRAEGTAKSEAGDEKSRKIDKIPKLKHDRLWLKKTHQGQVDTNKTRKLKSSASFSPDDAFVDVPDDLTTAREQPDEAYHEFQPLSDAELTKGCNLSQYLDDANDFDFDDAALLDYPDSEETDRQLDYVAMYADEQDESTRRGIKDIHGKPARRTTKMVEADPIEVDEMGMDQIGGGEDQLAFIRDFGIEADRIEEQERKSGPQIDQQAPPLRKTRKAKSGRRDTTRLAETPGLDAPEHARVQSKPNENPSVTRSAKPSKPLPSTPFFQERNARYGMDGLGNRTPSRFQWWQRATSRDTKSKESAKQVIVMRKSPRARKLQTKDQWYKPLKLYTDNFIPLIEAEQAHEETVIRQRLDTMPANRLVAEGYCLNELAATRDSASQAGRPTYTFAFGGKGGRRFTWNRFNPGTSIIISPAGEKVDPVKKEQSKRAAGNSIYNTGSIVSKTPGSLKVSFDERLSDEDPSRVWRLDIWTSDIVMRRAKEALATLHYDPVTIDRYNASEPEMLELPLDEMSIEAMNKDSAKKQTILPGTALRPVLLDGFIPEASHIPSPTQLSGPGFFADNEFIQSWCRRQLVEGRGPVEIEGDPHLTLNTSQRRAIATMLSSNVSLVQGPPGTGKTRTIIEMLHLLKVHWQVPQPILVSAYTNTACDNLAEGMSKRGLKVLRYGSRSRIRDDLKELTLDWYLEKHRSKRNLDWLKAETYRTPKDDPIRETLRRQLFGLERRMMHDVLLDVDVVCATCISSRGRLLEVVDFPVVFLDEASMATEPNALIPLTKGCQHAALIGDHKQLPPLVISSKAEEGHLQTSLFERLIKSGKIPSVMLDTQYRMHPAISAFPNKAFYGSELKDGTLDGNGVAKAGLEPPRSDFTKDPETGEYRTVAFIDHTQKETARAKSIVNEGEAKIIYDIVLDLLLENPDLKGDDIGIIAPYAGQISCIVNQLRHDSKRQRETWDRLGTDRGGEVDNIEIHTVDGFEGREKQIIVFSTTRSNDGNWIGFLQDWRRMNVGLTRAKSGLIIVGNRHTLENARSQFKSDSFEKSGAEYWRDLLRDLEAANAIVPLEMDASEEGWADHDVEHQNEELDEVVDLEGRHQEPVRMAS